MNLQPETRVNTYRLGEQTNPDSAALTDGSYVTVWHSQSQDGSGWGVYAQRFLASGAAFGPEFRVNAPTTSNQVEPRVAGTSDGGYVVVWEDDGGRDGSAQAVYGQRYSASGLAQGSNFLVNTSTSSSQYQADVAAYTGGFATVWASAHSGTWDIYLQRWDNAGNKVGVETLVSTVGGTATAQSGTQQIPQVAAQANGDLFIVWRDDAGNDGSSYGVYGRKYIASTDLFTATSLVNTYTSGAQYEPAVAALSDGGAIVVWRSDNQDGSGYGVYAQRYDAAGVKAGGEFLVNQSTNGGQYQPSVTGLSTGGFVVAWYNDNYDVNGVGSTSDVYVREYDGAGVPITGQIKLLSPTNSHESQPSIIDLGAGRYAVTYTDAAGGGNGNDIVQQLFGPVGSPPAQQAPSFDNFSGSVTFNENLINATPQLIQPVIGLFDPDSANFDGGRIDLFWLQGWTTTDQLGVRSVGNGPNQISVAGNTVSFQGVPVGLIGASSNGSNGSNLLITLNAAATVDAVEELIQSLTYASTSQSPTPARTVGIRVSDGDGGSSVGGSRVINVTAEADGAPALYGEKLVNSNTAQEQLVPDVTVLSDGSYVVVWQSSYQDTGASDTGIYFQRFTAQGVAVGGEFRANTGTAGNQDAPHAAALSNGGFVLIWDDNSGIDGSGQGVIGQIYNASGVAQGSNFVINPFTSNTQQYSDVVGYAGGGSVAAGFAAVWASTTNSGGSSYDIYLQRYDNGGARIGGELRVSTGVGVSTAQTGAQYLPRVAAYANGDLVIVWRDDGANDGGATYGVFGQRFNAATGSFSGTFQVNTYSTGNQYEPDVATLADGGFVVVWRSDNQDGNSAGVYGQRYNAAGAAVGGEFLVNETTAGGQYQPSVMGLSTGGFVVSFYNDNYDVSGAGTTSDAYVREYDAAGNPVDGQRKLISPSNSGESQAVLGALAGGGYVVVYTDYATAASGGSNSNDIVQQIFGTAAALPRQADPVVGDFTGVVTFDENLVNATPQVIDAAVSVSDADSADFAGGQLDLYFLLNAQASDQLGVRNVGNGVGQIGVAGNSISYGGSLMGTLSGGGNGSALKVVFTASATPEAVQALIQNLSYATTSQSPDPTRTVALRISDGDGGSSDPSVFTINVSQQLDGAPLVYGESTVNTYTADDQQEPEVAVLADGSYVITWQSRSQETGSDDYGIFAQRYTGKGVPVGPEVRVNTATGGEQSYPHVSALSGAGGGGYVITWQDNAGNDGASWGILGQRYDASGNRVGAAFVVNTFTSSNQYHPSVAGYNGGYSVVWTSTSNPGGNSYDIYLKRYDNNGAVVTGETLVSTVDGSSSGAQTGNQELPDVAAYPNGNLVIVWQDTQGNDGSGNGVYGRLYTAGTGTFSNTFRVSTSTAGSQYEPSVATLAGGGFVVTWRDDSRDGNSAAVSAQVFDAAGNKLGAEILVNETIPGGQYQPSVTGLSTGGFVVSFYNDNYDVNGAGTTSDAYIREYDATGAPIDGQRKLISPSNSGESQASLADLGGGNFVVAYTDYATAASGGNNTNDIVQQIFGSAAALARQSNPQIGDFVGSLSFGENLVNAAPQIIDAAVALTDLDSPDFAGGSLDLFFVRGNDSSDQLGVRNVGNGPGQIGVAGSTVSYGGVAIGSIAAAFNGVNGSNLRIDLNAAASVKAVETLIQSLTYANTSMRPELSRTVAIRVSDGDGGTSNSGTVQINVNSELDGSPVVYGESAPLNTQTDNSQDDPEIAVLADGSYVVVWTSYNQDAANTDGVYAQRFSPAGVALGAEFKVNTLTAVAQNYPHVAALSNGGFVVVWEDSANDGGGWGVYAQRYDSAGVAQGPNTSLPVSTVNNQYHGAVAGYTGGYAVVWSSTGNASGNGYDIYVRSYDNNGVATLPETRVSTVPGAPGTAQVGAQELPDVAAYPNGNLVIVWQDTQGNDGSGYGVYVRTFNAGTATFSDTTLVNTNSSGNQYEPSVATLAGGGFIVVWRDDSKDGSSASVVGQIFNAAGTKVGAEFLVNERTIGGQYQPAVTGLSTGGFVVTWYNDNYDVSGGGTTSDVYIREYNAAGAAIDGERKLLSDSNSTEYLPAIADLGNGNYVVAYADNSSGIGYDIRQQIFGDAAELVRSSANPVLDDLRVQRVLSNVLADPLYAGNAQLIDSDISLSDSDSANFSGGQLLVNLLSNISANDALGIRNQGNATGQIGVAGSDISYGGVSIGTMSGGGAGGAPLVVTFNASANAAAARALVENLTYLNSAPPAGTTNRHVGIRITDGDGGASDASVVQLTIQATATQPVLLLDDVRSDPVFTETQARAGVLVDDAVGLAYTGSTGFANGKFTVTYQSSTGRGTDQLSIRNEGSGTGQVSVSGSDVLYQGVSIGTISATLNGVNGANLDITFKAAATDQAIERVVENLVYTSTSPGPLANRTVALNVTDGASVSGTIRTVNIGVTPETDPGAVVPLFGERQVNTYESGDQTAPSVARLLGSNVGGYVIAWVSQDGQDGSGHGVFAQRYDAQGSAVGPEFQVNTQTLNNQTEATVGALVGGGYVIAWRADGQDGNGSYGVYAQRYGADGAPQGSEFRANTTTQSNQYQPAVLGLADGSFIVAYYSDYSNATATTSNDVLAQRYAANGTPLGTELTLNASGGATQSEVKLAALTGGGFVAIWSDSAGDASGYGIAAQLFTDAGVKVDGLIAINTTVAGSQTGPDIAALPGGGFVTAWISGSLIYTQQFSAAGAKVGAEIVVNTTVDSPANQTAYARVAALATGGYIVAWDGYPSASLGGSSQDIMAQQFDAAGNRVDGVKVISTTRSSTQYLPDIAGLTGNNAVLTWAGYNQESSNNSSYGVFQQLLGTSGSIVGSAAPLLVDLVSSVSFAENLVNTTPQLIDSGVSLTDSDSSNFDGGRLWVSTLTGYGSVGVSQLGDLQPSQDQLGIRNQGNGVGQVGVSGTAVSVGGTVIGTLISNGQAGADLVVQFNASATANAVEAVIENLTYANSSSSPVASRTVSVSVSDGDGGTSVPRTVLIGVTPEADGAPPLYGYEQVNTYASDTQEAPASARLSDGGYITVWDSQDQDGWSRGVYGQRFDSKGVAQGAEFRINTYTPGEQYTPSVVGLNGGGYVVVWRSDGQDGSGAGVYGQRFSNDGLAQGLEFRVNTDTDQNQYQPNVTATADGGFVVAWYDDYYTNAGNTEYRDIFFQRYNAAGVAQGAQTRANPAGEGTTAQADPAVAGLLGGGFVVTWEDGSKDGSSSGVYGQRFDAAGAATGVSFLVNTTTVDTQFQPAVAALADGGWVITWTSLNQDGNSYGVYGQRYSSGGTLVGDEFRVNTTNNGNQSGSAVTALSHGGFVVSYYSDGRTYVQQFDASGARLDGELRVDTQDNNGNSGQSAIVSLANGGFVVTVADYDYSSGSVTNVYQQLFGRPADFARQANPVLVDMASSVTFDENLVNAAPQLIDGVVGLSDADSSNFAGGALEVNYLTGYSLQNQLGLSGLEVQDQLGIRNQGSGVGQIGVLGSSVRFGGVEIGTITSNGVSGNKLTVQFNANASVVAVERLIENLTYANTFSDPSPQRTVSVRVTDGDGGASIARSVQINVTPQFDGAQPVFGNERVNTYEPGTQDRPQMALLSDGSYITVWQSDAAQDGWASGVYGQRFSAQGVPLGTEFQVHTYTPFDQYEPSVAALASGGYVVAWRSQNQDGSGAGIYAQRFSNEGLPQGSEFLVNSGTAQNQYQANVIGTSDGGFVIAWYSDYYTNAGNTEYQDVMFQRYNAAGAAVGAETRANPTGEGTTQQSQPELVALAGGGFVAFWVDNVKDGDSYGVYGRNFDATGLPTGGSFRVNSYTAGAQYEISATAVTGGGYVVVWRSDGQDGSSAGVYGQRYNPDGSTLGGEFRVNTTISGNQYQPQVSGTANGGFVVTWNSDSRTMLQQYDAAGVRLDGEQRVDNLDVNATASVPAVLGLATGSFVLAWPDYNYDTGSYNIVQQMYGQPATLVRQANPELVDVATSVSFGENLVNAVPQLIDGGVGLIDTDSLNFAGGTVEVNYLTGYGAQDALGQQGLDAQDQLGIRHQGTGDRQIGVSGNSVSYGGVNIGTITSNGANGNKLTVQFNANATADAVEHVIESLTYANTVSNPIASRTVSIRVTDGDGGASEPRNVVINVTAETDGAVRYGIERVVNTSTAGAQYEPSVARLADGGYVVVWEDPNAIDGSGNGVYGQRYDSADNAIAGGQFRVNTYTTSGQYEPQVLGLPAGGYVVVWRSDGQDGSGAGIYGQRYGADGVAQGTEFRVNTTTSSNQYQPTVSLSGDGFVVAWYHDSQVASGTDYYEIFFQRYNASGVAQGSETRASPPVAAAQFATQSEPSIAWLRDSDSGFVVTWSDNVREGDGYGVFAQRYTSAGVAEGSVVAVNSYVNGTQSASSVAGLKDGGFIVTWESASQDLSSTGIYAQRFSATGAKVGGEFRVNTSISGSQVDPQVTALESGGWAISWTDNTPTSGDAFVQQFDASGRAVDGETRVNTYTPASQYQPSIAAMGDGGFVVAYSGYIYSSDQDGDGLPDGGNNTQEIRLQRYSNTAPTVSNVSVSGQEEALIALDNTLFEGGFIDPEGQSLQAIRVVTLPAFGTLRLNGVAVTVNQEIGLENLQAGLLTYQGNVDYFGADQFRWTGSDGIAFAGEPVFTNILLSNVNDGPRLGDLTAAVGSEGSFYSRPLVIADPDPEGHLITVNWGDGTANSVFTTSANNPNIGHTFADNGNYTVTVTVNDQQGQPNSIESKGFGITVANVAPTISLSGANTVEQTLSYSLTLGNPSDPGTDTVDQYTVNWGDGSPVQTYTPATLPPNRIVTHSYANTGPVTINVGLRDEDGTYASAGTKTITVSAPAEVITVDAGANAAALEGNFFSRTITFVDPTDQGTPGRTYTVNWGDGQTSSGGISAGAFTFNIGHSYADNGGPYEVLVTVDDSGAVTQQGSDSFQVTVGNVAPVVSISALGSVSEGSLYTITLNPFDPGADTITQYVLSWGDGTPTETYTPATLPANRQLSHTYADGNNSFSITVAVTDEDGVFPAAGQSNVFVANVAPTAPVSGPNVVDEGSVYTLNVGAVTEPGLDTRTGYSINWGDGTPNDNYTPTQWAAAQLAGGNFTHVYADGAGGGSARTITVTASDEDGTHTLGSQSLTVGNAAPTLSISGAANTDEAASYTLAIVGSDPGGAGDPLSYTVDWGDGSAPQVLSAAQLAAQPTPGSLSHVYADDEDGPSNSTPRTITVTANDGDTGVTQRTLNLNVNNVAPTATLGGADTVNETSLYALNVGLVVDPGPDTRTAYSINWGDGITSNFNPAEWATAAGNFSHAYADGASAPTITVSATDEDGSFVLGSKLISVLNVAPQLAIAGAAISNEGASYLLAITGNDVAGAADPLSYTINWGDGSAPQTLTAAELASQPTPGSVVHVFADDEDGPVNSTPRTVSVTVNDGDGGTATQSRIVAVNNVAPTAAVSGAATVNEGSVYTLNVGLVSEPGTDTRSGYSIDWGDGNTSSFTPAQWLAAAGSFTHSYADGASTPTITVSTTDEDGSFVLGTHNVTVANVAPTLTLNGANAANEGSVYALAIAGSDPAGAADPLTYTIDWGDGSAPQVLSAAQLAAQPLPGTVTHVFADDQDGPVNVTPRTISVTVNDGDAGSTTQTQTVAISNVAPTVSLGGGNAAQTGTPYTLLVGAITDPGTDTVSQYTIDWGDGSAAQSLTAAQLQGLGGSVPHAYGAAGNYTVQVALVDEDGTFANAGTQAVSVSAQTPSVALEAGAAAVLNEGSTFSRTIAFTDGEDNGVAGWTYSIDYGDGNTASGSTLVKSLDLNHVYADGSANHTVTVTVNDGAGETATDSFAIAVNNVAPTATVSGDNAVNEGASYVLNVGLVSDPGADTRSAYSIDWGDGNISNYTPAEWATAAGSFSHVYADGASAPTIVVRATDEDGVFVLGSKTVTVNNVAPTLNLAGNADTNEGASYALAITGSDPAGAADPLSYSIDWGDGSAPQLVTAAQLAAQAVPGTLTHSYADDQDGPVNSTARVITVTATDGDGGSTVRTQNLNVNNVAPSLALGGSGTAQAGVAYTLSLGAITDPGTDTVSEYRINWGDGSAVQTLTALQVFGAGGNVPHTYAAQGNYTVAVSLVDEDGVFDNAGSQAVAVGATAATVAFEAGLDASLNEGSTFSRTINFTDGADNDAPGWTYSIDYGDGTVVSGSTPVQSLNLNHVYADGNASRVVTVTVTDVPPPETTRTSRSNPSPTGTQGTTDRATDSFTVTVNNVAPVATVLGAASVVEGSPYALSVGPVNDPGADTRTAYSIAWGDGAVDSYSAALWAAANGSFSHVYADGGNGGTSRSIVVSTTDEDGSFVLGSQTLTVANAAPAVVLAGNASSNEGAAYSLSITGSDAGGAADPLGYSINWGDGSPVQTLTAAQLAANLGVVVHVFADDEDGPVNSTLRSISVTVNDDDGGSSTQTRDVAVNNVAPGISLGGTGAATVGQSYTLNLGAITDPGQDTVSSWLVNWGDGNQQTYAAGGPVTHTYSGSGNLNIVVGLVDEDGTYAGVASQAVVVSGQATEAVTIGNAPVRLTLADPNAWFNAWTNSQIALTHRADADNAAESWGPVTLGNVGPTTLAGGDLSLGDLGVSGQTLATSTLAQEIDGSEGLRLSLTRPALSATINLSALNRNDDGLGYDEAGRVQAYDENGSLVAEVLFTASSSAGTSLVNIAAVQGFRSLVITSGAHDGSSFVDGAYAAATGGFGAVPFNSAGRLHGSEFLVDAVTVNLVVSQVVPQLMGQVALDETTPVTAMLGVAYGTAW